MKDSTSVKHYEQIQELTKKIRQLAQKNDDDYLYEKCNLILDHASTKAKHHLSESLGLSSPNPK